MGVPRRRKRSRKMVIMTTRQVNHAPPPSEWGLLAKWRAKSAAEEIEETGRELGLAAFDLCISTGRTTFLSDKKCAGPPRYRERGLGGHQHRASGLRAVGRKYSRRSVAAVAVSGEDLI